MRWLSRTRGKTYPQIMCALGWLVQRPELETRTQLVEHHAALSYDEVGDLFSKRRQLMEAWARYCLTPSQTKNALVELRI